MDDFYEPFPGSGSRATASGVSSHIGISNLIFGAPLPILISIVLAPFLVIIATRLLSGHPSEKIDGKDAKSVWMLPYWVPVVGHGFQFLVDPIKLMRNLRDKSAHGIFALNLGTTTHNIITDPTLVKGVMQQKESSVQLFPIAWNICEKFFGLPKRSKATYVRIWKPLSSYSNYLMKEPYLSKMLQGTIRALEENIPQMITFAEGEIDLQPWERWAKASYISGSETEIDLMSLMRDMMGHASVPGLFGHGLMEKYPDLLHDIYDMDSGFLYFLMGLPQWTPWPSVNRAHQARQRLWRALDDHQRALDATVDGKHVDSTWGDLDDVSEFIWKRNAMFRESGLEIKERGDISILWALVVNANLLVYWHILHILAAPGLAQRIRAEIAPYAKVSRPISIGKISAAPTLKLSHSGLAENCPLFKSTYLEALRVSDQPWSVRQTATDVVISGENGAADSAAFVIRKGEYITIPHDLHMKDPKYFKDPEKFEPERFLVHNTDGTLSTDMGTIRPYGGGPSMCKGRVFAERECLVLVAGVLTFWDIEPADKKIGWVIPKQKKCSAISLPATETRVRIKRRNFDWEEQTVASASGD